MAQLDRCSLACRGQERKQMQGVWHSHLPGLTASIFIHLGPQNAAHRSVQQGKIQQAHCNIAIRLQLKLQCARLLGSTCR